MTRAPRTCREFHWRMYGLDLPAQRERLKRQLVFDGEVWDLLDRPAWTEREYRELMAHYYGFITYLDAQIGRLLETLDRTGLARDTLVVYTTDHGEYMGGHGCIFKSMAMYDDLMRVPLLARLPGVVPPGHTTSALTSSVDFLPTLLDYAGVPIPASAQGKSLRPLLEARTERHHDAVFTAFPGPGVQMRMVRTERHKYSYNYQPRQEDELYDLQEDPNELDNLAGLPQVRDLEEQLRVRVFDHMDKIQDPWRRKARAVIAMPPLTRIAFDFDHDYELEYWQLYRGLSGVRIADGKLVGHIDCPGYMVARFDEPAKGDDCPVLEITMAATAGTSAQLYWATSDDPQMKDPMSVRFPIEGDGKMHTYRLELGEHAQWKGKTITHLRLNPVRHKPAPGDLSADWRIDRIGPPR